jgi:transposase-like protein
MSELAQVGTYCPNEACEKYQQVGAGNIIRYGKTRQGQQRFQCKVCQRTFNQQAGTIFYRRRTDTKDIVEALAMLAEGMRISSVARVKGVKADTVLVWLRRAAAHALSIEQALLEDYRLSACQIDALWTYVRSKEKKAQ